MAVPWSTIITALPALVDAAGRLWKSAESPPVPAIPARSGDDQLKAIIQRLEYFESLEGEQAKLLKQTIEQLQNVTVSSSATAMRANVAIGIAAIAVVVAAVALVM